MRRPVTLVLFLLVIFVIVPYLHLMLYISQHMTPRMRSNITLAIPDTSMADLPVIEVTSPPSRLAWMTNIEPLLRDRRVSDVIFPGTHMSASYSLDPTGPLVEASFITRVLSTTGFKRRAINWLQTQRLDIFQQLQEGIRALHFNIVYHKGVFSTYNGFSGESLSSVLKQIRKFVESYKREIVIFFVESLKEVDSKNQVKVMQKNTRIELLDVITAIFRNNLVPFRSNNPTIGELLETNRNVILVADIQGHGENVTNYVWPLLSIKTFKEDMWVTGDSFSYISDLLKRPTRAFTEEKMSFTFLNSTPTLHCHLTSLFNSRLFHCMVLSMSTICGYIGGCYVYTWMCDTTNSYCAVLSKKRRHLCVFLSAAILFFVVYLTIEYVVETVGQYGCTEGLLELGNYANIESEIFPLSNHISSRYSDLRGINSALTHWLTRPSLYKANVIFVNDFESSNVVTSAIEYNRGSLRRRIMVVYVGSPLVGSKNIRSWFACAAAQISYLIVSHDEGKVVTWSTISPEGRVLFMEGEFPMDSQIIFFAGAPSRRWFQLYSGNLHQMIDRSRDLFIRASESRSGRGVAYISDTPDLVSSKCVPDPTGMKNALNHTKWDAKPSTTDKNCKTINLS